MVDAPFRGAVEVTLLRCQVRRGRSKFDLTFWRSEHRPVVDALYAKDQGDIGSPTGRFALRG